MMLIRLAALSLFLCSCVNAQTTAPAALPDRFIPAAEELASQFADRLHRSRYMESTNVKPIELADWKDLPTQRYTYTIKDKDGTVKTADVVMLNPTAKQIARWIVYARVEVTGDFKPEDGKKIFQHILSQSGGQFPVRGIVYEDILPPDGKNEIYCFRDGVTVQIEGVPHRGTDLLTPEQIEKSINGNVTRVFTYARIQSTSPQQWIDSGGDKQVFSNGKPTQKWLDEVRTVYQKAWNSDRNELLIAWVKANYPAKSAPK